MPGQQRSVRARSVPHAGDESYHPPATADGTDQSSTPAYKMHNLHLIALTKQHFAPAASCGNMFVELHRNAIAFQSEMLDELRERDPVGTLFRIAVYDHCHNETV